MGASGERPCGILALAEIRADGNGSGTAAKSATRGREEGQLLSEEKLVLSLRVPLRMFTKRSLRERGWRDSNKSGEQLPLAEIREARRP